MKGQQNSEYVFLWGDTEVALNLEGNIIALRQYQNNIWNRRGKTISISKNNRISCYISRDDIKREVELGKKFFDKQYVQDFLSESQNTCATHWSMFRRLKATDFSLLSDSKLVESLQHVQEQWAETYGYFRGMSPNAIHHLYEKIRSYLSPDEVAVILTPPEMDDVAKEQMDWQTLLQSEEDEKCLLSHAEKYPWLVSYHFTYADVVRTLRE